MTSPASGRLQEMLQAAVQSAQWTYSLFWQFCSQQGVLVWTDGYYNGAIKTRKTIQPMEVTAEEATLQRSQQLRELYESLLAGDTNQPARRPCAALSPEDLTESEWFYLMCVSFSFPPGVGLPGKAYARRQHVWLTGANDADSKVFSRAILAKSARIQTIVCIPLVDGVVELGNTERVQEDLGLIKHVKSFFTDLHIQQLPHPKPALSEHSTSNQASASQSRFESLPLPSGLSSVHPPAGEAHEVIQEDDEEDEDDELESDSEDEAERDHSLANPSRDATQPPVLLPHDGLTSTQGLAEPSELMQLEMSEDIRIGSPDEYSNNLDTSNSGGPPAPHSQNVDESYRADSLRAWPLLQEELSSGLPPTGAAQINEVAQEDNHYSQTVTAILQRNASRMATSSSSSATGYYLGHSLHQSAFLRWSCTRSDHLHLPAEGTSQWKLKYILFSVPFLHSKYRDESSPKSPDGNSGNRFKKGTPQDELSANHVLAERRRREKLNERFIILRSLVPFVTKMDKASILGDTIEYVKQLRRKIHDLEIRNRQMETEQIVIKKVGNGSKPNSSNEGSKGNVTASNVTSDRSRGANQDRKKKRVVEGCKGVEALPENMVQVSIIESDALLELECPYRDGLLLHILQALCELRLEVTAVQSSSTNGVFVAELRAKVKDRVNGKKASIVEVKKAIHQIIL